MTRKEKGKERGSYHMINQTINTQFARLFPLNARNRKRLVVGGFRGKDENPCRHLPRLLDFASPSLYAITLAAHRNFKLDTFHALSIIKEVMVAHATCIGPLGWQQLQHGQQEIRNLLGILNAKVIFLPENIWKSPVAQAVDVSQFTAPVEYLLRPFARLAERFGKRAEKFDDLCNVVVVFTVLGTRLWVEEIVARNKFKNLFPLVFVAYRAKGLSKLTMAAMLQTSVLAPHLAPRITSGERYCLV